MTETPNERQGTLETGVYDGVEGNYFFTRFLFYVVVENILNRDFFDIKTGYEFLKNIYTYLYIYLTNVNPRLCIYLYIYLYIYRHIDAIDTHGLLFSVFVLRV